MKVAIVHDRLTIWGGAERVVEELHRMFPAAPVHVALLDREVVAPGLQGADLRPGPLQRLYRGQDRYAHLLPVLPLAFGRLDLTGVDLVLTSHYAFAHRVRPPPGVPVVSYVHHPSRWMWDPAMRTGEIGGRVGRAALAAFSAVQRPLDRRAAERVHTLVAGSQQVAGQIQRWWGRESTVIVPPVDITAFTPDAQVDREDFFLFAGRLVPYKRAPVAVQAARRAGVRLVVAGDGRQRELVGRLGGPGTEVLGAVGDVELADLYRRCRALVFPGEEHFGIVPVEAQACGTPVLALAAGGALETVVDGVTGSLYPAAIDGDEVGALVAALARFDPEEYDPATIRAQAERFAPARFRAALGAVIRAACTDARRGRAAR